MQHHSINLIFLCKYTRIMFSDSSPVQTKSKFISKQAEG